ncbi:MAG: hypothetical protein HPY50_14385 [Firmicutes bacterium]|nr:hypothetical protein [Bacillota bacterium]
MMKDTNIENINRLIIVSALIILAGAMLSGPVSTGLLMIFKPQPKWHDAATFIQNYHWMQTIPFLLGFILMLGSCMLVVTSARSAREETHRIMCNLALIAVTVYSALISLNYIIQTAYVPMLVKTDQEFVGYLTMANPSSLCWGIEMFGYLFQGAAFWLLYPVFENGRHYKAVKNFLLINLLLSIGGAVAACIDIAWVLKPFGYVMFIVWNLVLVILMILVIVNRRNCGRLPDTSAR